RENELEAAASNDRVARASTERGFLSGVRDACDRAHRERVRRAERDLSDGRERDAARERDREVSRARQEGIARERFVVLGGVSRAIARGEREPRGLRRRGLRGED